MKKIIFIIIFFLNIFPVWKNESLSLFQVNESKAQSSGATALITLRNYLRANFDGGPNGRYSYNIVGERISRTDNDVPGFPLLIPLSSYLNNTAFQQYASTNNTPLPPNSNEYPNETNGVNWAELQFELDNLRTEARLQAFADIQWWGSGSGGSEPNNTFQCTESMYITTYSYNYFDGTGIPENINPLTLPPPNLPCSNTFSVGGNILQFTSSQITGITNYNFNAGILNGVTLNNVDNYTRAIKYDVTQTIVNVDSYNSNCISVENVINYLQNKRGSYQFICFPKITDLSSVESLNADGTQFYKNMPENEPGYVFTLPDSSITPSQVGDNVIGINSTNRYSCQTLDCAKVANGSASIGSCGICIGGSTGVIACYVDTPRIDTVKPTKIPCTPEANARGIKLTNMRDSINSLPDALRLKDSALNSINESGISITKNGGNYSTFNFQSGASNNVAILTSSPGQNIVACAHSHNKGSTDSTNAANSPSPLDIYHLINGQAGNPNFIADYVFAHDSTEWAIMIDDTTKAHNLTINIPMDSAAPAFPANNHWSRTFKLTSGKSLYDQWIEWVAYLYNEKHYSFDDKEGFANVLFTGINLEAGVKYYKKVNGQFKELSYNIINDASGTPIGIDITICE